MSVLRFPGHLRANCDPCCEGCCICNGGLFSCVTCKGGEGSLPTDCPGERMTPEQQDEVYSGRLDYRRTRGWIKADNQIREEREV